MITTGTTVDRVPVVIMVTQFGLTGVHSHADVDGNVYRPSLPQEKLLGSAGSTHGIRGPKEYGKDAVSFTPGSDHRAIAGLNGGCQKGIVAGHDTLHFIRMLLPQRSASLYVGEEVGDHTGGKV